MKLHVLAVGIARGKDLAPFRRLPDFRKATPNMVQAYAALEPMLPMLETLSGARDSAALVVGSSYGELSVTADFLGTLETQGIARPLLFQNSLHNATLGFLAIKLGLTGPSLTVSHRYFTGENCLEAAEILMGAGAPLGLAVAVESRVASLESALAQNYPPGISLTEGAGALLLAREEEVRRHGWPSLAVIESVECFAGSGSAGSHASAASGTPDVYDFYDSDALERIAQALTGELPTTLRLPKPDGSYSEIRLSLGAPKNPG